MSYRLVGVAASDPAVGFKSLAGTLFPIAT